MELEKCGCGKPAKYYSLPDGRGSCNKYFSCLTWGEQDVLICKLQHENRKYKNSLESIVELVDGEPYEYRSLAKTAIKSEGLESIDHKNEVYQHNIMMSAKD